MNHIGIDLGGKESQICIRSPSGAILSEYRIATSALGSLLAEEPKSRVILETCAEAFAIAAQLKTAGHEVRVVPATLVRSLGVGARGVKTDRRDARVLSEVSCRIELPSVHVPSEDNQELRSLLQMRLTLLSARTMMVNSVRGYLRTRLLRLRRGTNATFVERVREAVGAAGGVPCKLERQLKTIETMNEQVSLADAELKELTQANVTCRLMMTAPGVGPVTAARFMCAIDDPHRFATARSVASYLGLTPGENSSSERQRRTGLTKAGCASLRSYLVQGAWSVLRQTKSDGDPLVSWAHRLARRRARQVAVCAVARKLSVVLWAMWRDNEPYNPRRLRQPAAQEPAAA